MTLKTAALKVPILPESSPSAPQPRGFKLPLHPHQLRALHRCLLIESSSSCKSSSTTGCENQYSAPRSSASSLSTGFGQIYDFKSRGGCLADAVGVGKTATSLGLILEGTKGNGGDTLVVAPGHLIPQWKSEIEKFVDNERVEIVVGKTEYEQKLRFRRTKTRIVLMDVDAIMNEERLWYNYRRVFTSPMAGRQLRATSDEIAAYRTMALYCVKSAKGPCGYDGWIYPGSLHNPSRPWRRVIYDEIQDLVSEGTESQKNLLQLSRTAQNVWLLSATPFPFGNKSVYANHELLGFCRLRLDVEVNHPLPHNHTFEIIKRKLYIRSPPHVADEAVTASKEVTNQTEIVHPTALERKFYHLEMEEYCSHTKDTFADDYSSLRQMMVHPEASKRLREQINGNRLTTKKKPTKHSTSSTAVGTFSSVNSFAISSLSQARARLHQITSQDLPLAMKQLHSSTMSTNLATRVRQCRNEPRAPNPFSEPGQPKAPRTFSVVKKREADAIHSFYCRCSELGSDDCVADSKVNFRAREDIYFPETICGKDSTRAVIAYFQTKLSSTKRVNHGGGTMDALDHYIMHSEHSKKFRAKAMDTICEEKNALTRRIEALEKTTASIGSRSESGAAEDLLASSHGSKPAALIRFLRNLKNGEKTIVFSYWHDTLRLIWKTLTKCGLRASFCDGDGRSMSRAIRDFTLCSVNILLLSAQSKASGANLQAATHVVLLDPPGSSAEHGATLEQQAIGRAVRMGQEKKVTVTRFCVKDSVEESLFADIDAAAARLKIRSSDAGYVCENASLRVQLTADNHCDEQEDDYDEGWKGDDIIVTESISVADRVARDIASARKNGTLIEILDDENLSLEFKLTGNTYNQEEKESNSIVANSMCVNKRVPRNMVSTKENVTIIDILDDDNDATIPVSNTPIITVPSNNHTGGTMTENTTKSEFPTVVQMSLNKMKCGKRPVSTAIDDSPGKQIKVENVTDPETSLAPNIIQPSPIMEKPKTLSFEVQIGSLVMVESRTWPGMNHQGGVAKVTAMRENARFVDVKYILGGTERDIYIGYIHKHSFDHNRGIGGKDNTKNTRRSARKKRIVSGAMT